MATNPSILPPHSAGSERAYDNNLNKNKRVKLSSDAYSSPSNIAELHQELINEMNILKTEMNNKFVRLELHDYLFENKTRRELGLPQIPVPFIIGVKPDNFPDIYSVKDIQRLSRKELKIYLAGYDISHDEQMSIVGLKRLLRDSLKYSAPIDVIFAFNSSATVVTEQDSRRIGHF